ncbi:PREDICTED: RNA polymerase II degradation factor 1-like [Nicotiana attenuata]|uniref:RNA polymerase II degradation factor 1-like n=1 Tax=Nicotiana attenuata TaxID=49451 RepID=UPI0009055CFB|nr:PREDICTED: RNA polymerase II degradation factor 1-like [Nicotiana attenuata]
MSRVITRVVNEGDRNYPFPNFLTMYLNDLDVEKRRFDVKVKAKAPFSWYNTKGPDNPKDPKGKAPTSAGQSEEPVVVVTPSQPPSATPDTTRGPSTSTVPDIPSSSAYPLIAHHLNQTLASINNLMQAATSKLSVLSTSVEAQSVPPQPQLPQSVEDTLKELLDNQKLILEAVDSHGKALKELTKETKKLRKTRASKESVKELRADVEKMKVDHSTFDLLLHDPGPAAQPEPERETKRPAKRRRVIPRADDAVIELEDPQGGSSSQPQIPVQAQDLIHAQVPVETQNSGSQPQVPEQTEDPGTQPQDPMQAEGQ